MACRLYLAVVALGAEDVQRRHSQRCHLAVQLAVGRGVGEVSRAEDGELEGVHIAQVGGGRGGAPPLSVLHQKPKSTSFSQISSGSLRAPVTATENMLLV
jgi:hypothetical protein